MTELPASNPAPRDEETQAHRSALQRAELRKHLVTLADQVAGEPMHFRNYKWPSADQEFPDPQDAPMRFVTKYYPYTSTGKPLYVDEPRSLRELSRAYERQKILRKLGLRHVVIEEAHETEEGEQIPASTLGDLLEQLGEL